MNLYIVHINLSGIGSRLIQMMVIIKFNNSCGITTTLSTRTLNIMFCNQLSLILHSSLIRTLNIMFYNQLSLILHSSLNIFPHIQLTPLLLCHVITHLACAAQTYYNDLAVQATFSVTSCYSVNLLYLLSFMRYRLKTLFNHLILRHFTKDYHLQVYIFETTLISANYLSIDLNLCVWAVEKHLNSLINCLVVAFWWQPILVVSQFPHNINYAGINIVYYYEFCILCTLTFL